MIELAPFVIQPHAESFSNHPNLRPLVQQLMHAYHCQQVQDSLLQTIGYLLWQLLDLESSFTQAYDNHKKLALIINCDDPFLQSLPWESLYHPTLGFLGKHPDFTLSRCLSHQLPLQLSHNLALPLTILLFTIPHPNLFFEEEQHQLFNSLLPWTTRGLVKFHSVDDGYFSTLVDLLAQQNWDIVIISGHAQFKESQTLFQFTDIQTSLNRAFESRTIPCVILAACETAYSEGNDFSLAAQLVNARIPHVIGMQANLLDRAGTVFVQHFCQHLLQDGRLDKAVQYARSAMITLLTKNEMWQTATDLSTGQWCLPVLYSVQPSQTLSFDFKAPVTSLPQLTFLGQSFELPKLLIGRRKTLNHLKNSLVRRKIDKLWLYGVGGVGKTALASELARQLQLFGYQVLIYSANQQNSLQTELCQHFQLPTSYTWYCLIERLEQQLCLLWLDNIDVAHYQTFFAMLSRTCLKKLTVIITSRQKNANITSFSEYLLKPPSYESFQKYIRYLGLPYEKVQIQLAYKMLQGNFKGVQLLQSLPYRPTGQAFAQQLIAVRRYLQSYQKINS